MSRSPLSGRNDAFLGLGGNLGEPLAAMAEALQILDANPHIRVTAVSLVYKTPPWGKLDQPDFLNAAAAVSTSLDARALLDASLDAERRLKRVRVERWGPRLIDIDVLWFAGRHIREVGLEIPHPRMQDRAFVMVPLAEIAPDLQLAGRSAAEIASQLDRGGIEPTTTDRDWWRFSP